MSKYNRRDKVRFAIIRYIEAELNDFKDNEKLLINMRDDEITGSPLPEEGSYINSRNNVSKPTERKAVNLITNKRIQQLERTVNAINKVLNMLDPGRRELVELRYFERKLTPIGVADKIHIAEKTFYNWRREVITLIAIELGLVNAVDVQKDCSFWG